MKNTSKRTPPLLQGALALTGLILLILGGFSLWQWYRTRPLRAALDSFTADVYKRQARRLAQTGGRPDHSAVLRLMVLNSASLQLIPANVAAVRAAAGSAQPFAILPAVWLASLGSVCAALAVSALLERVWRP